MLRISYTTPPTWSHSIQHCVETAPLSCSQRQQHCISACTLREVLLRIGFDANRGLQAWSIAHTQLQLGVKLQFSGGTEAAEQLILLNRPTPARPPRSQKPFLASSSCWPSRHQTPAWAQWTGHPPHSAVDPACCPAPAAAKQQVETAMHCNLPALARRTGLQSVCHLTQCRGPGLLRSTSSNTSMTRPMQLQPLLPSTWQR